jgi:hypothetical protein
VEKIPITGTRIPVVNYESSVKADGDAKDISLILPLSEMGRDWPQAGGGADHVMPNFLIKEPFTPLWTASIGAGNGEGRLLTLLLGLFYGKPISRQKGSKFLLLEEALPMEKKESL